MMRRSNLLWAMMSSLLLSACGAEDMIEGEVGAEAPLTANGLSATLSPNSDWGSGYCQNLTLTNVGTSPITQWRVEVELNGSVYSSGWSATLSTSGSRLIATPLAWNANLAPQASTTIGFCANGSGRPAVAAVTANGSGAGTGGTSGGSGGTSGGGTSTGGTSTGGATGSTPYSGSPAAIPGTIQVESFDNGGEGVAFHDVDATNSGGAYRTTGVDIEATTDAGGGYDVGWTKAGEWLNYTVNVATAGTYTLQARVASNGGGGSFHVEFGGTNATGTMTVPNTGGWQTYQTVSKTVTLSSGKHIMRLVADSNGSTGYIGNFNWISLTAAGSGTGGTGGAGGSGGASTGGTGTGGTGGGVSCPFPTSFKWTSTGPLAQPKSPSGRNFVSLKDFTAVRWNNQFVVYATVFDTSNGSWSGVNINFADWPQMATAPQTYLGNLPTGGTVAPTLFYFTPKQQWVLTYQWGFKYATTTDPTRPSTWTSPRALLSGDPTGGTGTGPIDQTVICDTASCYLFFAGDNGHIYRASMPIGSFPGTFTNATSIMSDTTANLFEGVQVYSVKGTGRYLMIVEAMGSGGRYFRAFSATSLGGAFTAISGASTEATPFAGKRNVTFTGTAWTNDISHGDIVRTDPSETQTIDPCNMQFLYQGRDPSKNVGYNELPYRPGLLTRTN